MTGTDKLRMTRTDKLRITGTDKLSLRQAQDDRNGQAHPSTSSG